MPNAALLPGKKLTSSKLFTNLNSVVFYFLHLLHCYKISRISRSKQTKILKLEFYIFHTFMFRFYFSFRTKFQFTRKENNLNPRENDCVAMVHIFDFEELYLLFLPVQTHTITLLKPNTEDFLGLYNGGQCCRRLIGEVVQSRVGQHSVLQPPVPYDNCVSQPIASILHLLTVGSMQVQHSLIVSTKIRP